MQRCETIFFSRGRDDWLGVRAWIAGICSGFHPADLSHHIPVFSFGI
jgi:hypothetical protein